VGHGLRRGDRGKLGAAAAAERAARRSEQDAAYAGAIDTGVARAQALEDRAVLAVDRNDLGACLLGGTGQQFAGQYQ